MSCQITEVDVDAWFPVDGIHVLENIRYQWKRLESAQGRGITYTNTNGPFVRYAKLQVRMRGECRERFPRHRR